MNGKVIIVLAIAAVLALSAACAPAPTPVPPTTAPTPVPPTLPPPPPPTLTAAPSPTVVPTSVSAMPTIAATAAATATMQVMLPSNPGDPGPALNLKGDPTKGAQVFAVKCQACHGNQGKGGVKNPGSTDGTVPALNPVDEAMGKGNPMVFARTLDLFVEHGSTPDGPNPALIMPSFGDSKTLSPQQIADVIAYVMSLNGGAPATAAATVAPPAMAEELAKDYPKNPPSISAGAKGYTTNCVACHGDKGDGKGVAAAGMNPASTDFTDPEHARGDSPEGWYNTVTGGSPNSAMPSYGGKLNEADRWNAIFYARNFITTPEKIAMGKDLYAKNCAVCHGDKGDGKGPAGAALNPAPSNFTDAPMMAAHASQELFGTLTNGKGAMPAFKSSLTDDQRWNLVDYLWTYIYAP